MWVIGSFAAFLVMFLCVFRKKNMGFKDVFDVIWLSRRPAAWVFVYELLEQSLDVLTWFSYSVIILIYMIYHENTWEENKKN